MRQKKIILPVLVLALFFGSFCFAKAVGTTTVGSQKKAEVRQEFEALKEKLEAAKCARVERQVKNRIARFDNQQLIHVASYEKTKTLIAGKVAKLKEKGYDVAKLEADLVQYGELITKFKTDYANYVTMLKDTQNYACGQSEGAFRTQLAKARAQLKVVHQDAVEIRTFWAKTIRPDFVALKSQKPANEDGDETDTSTNPDSTTTTTTNPTSGE